MPHELAGRRVYNRTDLIQRTGRSLSALEKLYRQRATNGHPEHVATIDRAKVWDAAAWDTWWRDHTDTTGLCTLDELADQIGRSPATTRAMWANRATNGHPAPRKSIDGLDRWNPQEYAHWHQHDYLPTLATARTVHRRGDPEDRINLSEVARELGKAPDSIAKYVTRPPRGWPDWDPDADQTLPGGRVRHHWRRGDIWAYADAPRAPGGPRPRTDQPTGSYPDYTGDYRLAIAHQALATTPADQRAALPRRLASEHPDTSAGTWANIIAAARRTSTN